MFQNLRFDVGNSEIIREYQLLLAYRLFCLFNYPLWKLILVLRKAKGKEHRDRYIEKLGFGYLPRPEGEVIWVHALGLGETLSLTLFLQKLSSFNKDKTVLFTSSTLQSYEAFSKLNLNSNILHQFAPIDNTGAIKSFLNHWKPSISLISELDLWPNRILEISKLDIPLVLFNTRMNKRKRDSRKAIFSIFKKTLSFLDFIFLQDEASVRNFEFFGVPIYKMKVIGPFKTAGSIMAKDHKLSKILRKWAKKKFVWIAASIHQDEEVEVLEAFKLTKRILPNLALIIVPRYIELSNITEKRCKTYTESIYTRKSNNNYPDQATDILLVSTVGELGVFYDIADIAFVGNSLDYKKIKTGKNPFEAIQRNCVVMHGPKMLEPSYSLPSKEGITEIVQNRFDISECLQKYYSVEQRGPKIKLGADFIRRNQTIIEDFIFEISKLIEKGTRKL